MLFVQGFLGLFLHLETQDHYYCSVHQHITHDAEHVRDSHASNDRDRDSSHLSSDDSHSPHDDRDEHDESGDSCEWLTWMHETSVSYPPVYAQLLNLPPPAERLDTRRTDASRVEQRPIALRRLAPNKSPPPTFA